MHKETQNCDVSVKLVNGDVTIKYRHPGYQKAKHLSTIDRTVSGDSEESWWISEIMEVIDEVPPTHWLINTVILYLFCFFLNNYCRLSHVHSYYLCMTVKLIIFPCIKLS